MSPPLIKRLELPLPPTLTRVLGIHQSDVVIRSAIIAALADMRAQPWLFDYVFASLPQDMLTWKDYGEKSVQEAKTWFLSNNIPVKMTPVLNEIELPCITITLVDSAEAIPETTLADVDGDGYERNDRTWPSLVTSFTPKSYNVNTGTIVLADKMPEGITIGPGMFIVDNLGHTYAILSVTDDLTFKIAPGTMADFSNCTLKAHKPSWITAVESSSYRETYRVGIHVGGEPVLLTWIHSVIVFALLRYKEALLEGRGFERSTFSSSEFTREEKYETEMVFSRYVNVSGFVRHYWPKAVTQVIDVVQTQPVVSGGVSMTAIGIDPDSQLWAGDLDSLAQNK
jgi:hypothetical protein